MGKALTERGWNILRTVGLYRRLQLLNEARFLRKRMMFYQKFIQQGNLVFDVGANIGNRTNVFASLGAKVVAIEPQISVYKYLSKRFENHKNIICINCALDTHEGFAEIYLSKADGLSSMSQEWIRTVKLSGRFSHTSWDKKQMVQVTTLSNLISQFGVPDFIKIDVEGYELNVIRGLTYPVKALSFEFTPEYISSSAGVIEHLQRLGDYVYNFSVGESMRLEYPEWCKAEDILRRLSCINDPRLFGDIYARLP